MNHIFDFSSIATNFVERIDPSAGDETNYIGLEHLSSDSLFISKKGIQTELKGQKIKMSKGDVLFARRNAYLRRVGIAPFDGIFSAHGLVLRPNEAVIDKELFPFLIKSDIFMDRAVQISVGSLSPTVNWKDLKKEHFSIPDINEQKQIANVLWAMESLIEQYRNMLQLFDELIKSRFIEMFGDCKETIPIGKVCSLHSRIGWQALTKAEHMTTGEYMLITGTDFKDGAIDYSGCKYVSKDRYEMDPNIIIQNGDVLVTKDGTIGKVAVVKDLPKPATLNAGVFVVRNTDNQFLTEFIQQCLLSSDFQRFIESVKRGATIVHLNQEKFLKYELPVADLDLQHQFVEFVQQIDKSKVICDIIT